MISIDTNLLLYSLNPGAEMGSGTKDGTKLRADGAISLSLGQA